MSIEIIVLSFGQDSEEHQGLAQYAPPILIETLGDHNEVQRLTQGPQWSVSIEFAYDDKILDVFATPCIYVLIIYIF